MQTVDPALIPPNEAERLAAIHRYDILDSPPDGAFDRITSLAARLLRAPIAIVSVVDADRIWFKSHHGIDTDEIGRDAGLCASAILHEGPWVINDAPHDPRALANPLVAGEFGLKFYAGVPLRTADGYGMGTLCVLDFEPRQLDDDEVGALEDLAGMVMSELELRLASRHAISAAREREEFKDAFVAMVSHELRAPATVIFAATQMLASDQSLMEHVRAHDLVPDIQAESGRLLRLLDDLLVLARLEQGNLVSEREPVLLQRVLPRVVEQERRRRPDRDIRLHVTDDLSAVHGDPLYIEQVVSNLLSNALKYSPSDQPVDVATIERGTEIEIRVRDRGLGMSSQDQQRAFDLMYRAGAAKDMAPGAGVGLYVCRRLLDAMGGTISVAAAPESGSVFTVTLPVSPD